MTVGSRTDWRWTVLSVAQGNSLRKQARFDIAARAIGMESGRRSGLSTCRVKRCLYRVIVYRDTYCQVGS